MITVECIVIVCWFRWSLYYLSSLVQPNLAGPHRSCCPLRVTAALAGPFRPTIRHHCAAPAHPVCGAVPRTLPSQKGMRQREYRIACAFLGQRLEKRQVVCKSGSVSMPQTWISLPDQQHWMSPNSLSRPAPFRCSPHFQKTVPAHWADSSATARIGHLQSNCGFAGVSARCVPCTDTKSQSNFRGDKNRRAAAARRFIRAMQSLPTYPIDSHSLVFQRLS